MNKRSEWIEKIKELTYVFWQTSIYVVFAFLLSFFLAYAPENITRPVLIIGGLLVVIVFVFITIHFLIDSLTEYKAKDKLYLLTFFMFLTMILVDGGCILMWWCFVIGS